MDTSVMAILRGSQCESLPVEHESQSYHHLSRSIVETSTRFLACMVDTQDYICQMKNTYVKELWPKVYGELMESGSRLIGLERELTECKIEKERNRQLYMQQVEGLRMAREDERSRWVRELESLRECLQEEEEMCQPREVQDEVMRLASECAEAEKKINDLQQKIDSMVELHEISMTENAKSNEELTKQVQTQGQEIDELKKALEVARLKTQIHEQHRPLQEDSEDRYRRERRLSLRKQRLSQVSSGSPLGPWRGEQGIDESLTGLRPGLDLELLKTLVNIPTIVPDKKNGSMDPPCRSPANIRYLAPGIKRVDLEADVATAKGNEPKDQTDERLKTKEAVLGSVAEKKVKENSTLVDSTALLGSRAADFTTEDTRQPALDSDNIIKCAGPVTEGEHQGPPLCSAHQADVPLMPAEGLATGIERAAKQQFRSLTSNPGCNQNSNAYGASELPDSRAANGDPVPSSHGKQRPSDVRGMEQEHKLGISKGSSKIFPEPKSNTTHNSTGKKSKERKWRQTRSRTEGDGEDLLDSFLSTPRELVLANLAKSQAVPSEPRLSARNREREQSPSCFTSNKAKKEANSTAAFEWTDDCEVKEKQTTNSSRASGGMSAERTEKVEKSSRPLSAARTYSAEKEKTSLSSKAPGYKFNEPVRKKREREQLEATDCLQCRKFYDAVLAEDAEGVTMNRCEHHDAVSRHRYKYLPPGTPAGFWNIGFDSDY
ncbi:hypothetical protein R1sor_018990 [Riccia sorocarpa]|uniref:DNA endonuclease activator Ctp1 C-terminal domain-containing protein n=1 Tax=Riccia sorocarpa TaxID=122646 RepID=A0ABD3IBD3_9MARC